LSAIATSQVFPQDITAHAGYVYFTLQNAGAGGKLMKVTNTGGMVTQLGTTAASGSPFGVAMDMIGGNRIYWTEYGGGTYTIFLYDQSTSTQSTVRSVPNGNVGGLAADDLGLYYTEPMYQRSVRQTVGGGAFAVEQSINNPGRMFAIGGYVYYVYGSGGAGAVHRMKNDGSFYGAIASNLTNPSYVTSDGVNVYWSDPTDAAVYRAPVTGGTPQRIMNGFTPYALTVDGSYVYYLASSQAVHRIPK